ncbi:MAG TPA: metal-dependent hydrolase [Candidatus Saccharimonadales bacterium]|nr:metal-dependent hydrolase [Candidatus Saccharimonadales bacterium]
MKKEQSGGTMTKLDLGVGITWIGHGTVLYRSASGKNVLADAWVDTNPAATPEAKNLPKIDVVLITHAHGDHMMDLAAIVKKHDPEIVCIHEIAEYLEGQGWKKVQGMGKGGTISVQGIRVTMTHAVHSSSFDTADKSTPAGEPAGFVIQFENGTRVYHAGDTAAFSDMKLIAEIYKPTIAALPIGDRYTMSPLEASYAAKMLGVKHVLPIHHSTFPILTGKPEELTERLKGTGIEVLAVKAGETV